MKTEFTCEGTIVQDEKSGDKIQLQSDLREVVDYHKVIRGLLIGPSGLKFDLRTIKLSPSKDNDQSQSYQATFQDIPTNDKDTNAPVSMSECLAQLQPAPTTKHISQGRMTVTTVQGIPAKFDLDKDHTRHSDLGQNQKNSSILRYNDMMPRASSDPTVAFLLCRDIGYTSQVLGARLRAWFADKLSALSDPKYKLAAKSHTIELLAMDAANIFSHELEEGYYKCSANLDYSWEGPREFSMYLSTVEEWLKEVFGIYVRITRHISQRDREDRCVCFWYPSVQREQDGETVEERGGLFKRIDVDWEKFPHDDYGANITVHQVKISADPELLKSWNWRPLIPTDESRMANAVLSTQ